jgi:hypothetical protein
MRPIVLKAILMLVAAGGAILAVILLLEPLKPVVRDKLGPPVKWLHARYLEATTLRVDNEVTSALLKTELNFSGYSAERLHELRSDPDHGRAIRAAWEQVRRSVHRSEKTWRFDPDVLAEFVPFVQGRLGIRGPNWWRTRIANVHTFDNGRASFSRGDEHSYELTGSGLFCPQGTTVQFGWSTWTLTKDDCSTVLSRRVLSLCSNNRESSTRAVVASICKDRVYLAVHEIFPVPFLLSCIDRRTGSIRWRSFVVPGCHGVISVMDYDFDYRHFSYHWVDIVENGREVLVFGVGKFAAYVEGFDADDGTNRFRFSTAF